jgi:hypothetical protein
MRVTKTAVIIGTQRCGSNFFLSACQKLEDLTVFGEMYHRGGAFPFGRNPRLDFATRQHLGETICASFPDHLQDSFVGWRSAGEFTDESNAAINKALVKFSHKAPNRYFEALRSIAKNSRLIFKIFPEHLDMLQILSVLREQRPHVLFLLRNPLDTFISYKKLVQTEKPQDVDTSELKIKFNPAEYFAFKAAAATYYRTIREYCEYDSLGYTTCHYEWLHGSETDNKVEKVREQMQRVFGEPFKVAPGADTAGLFKRQDKSESPAQKVINPGALPRGPQTLLCE